MLHIMMKNVLFKTFLLLAVFLCACTKEDPSIQEQKDRANATISQVKVNGSTAAYDATTSTFTVVLPTVTDFSSVLFSCVSGAGGIKIDGVEIAGYSASINASEEVTVTAQCGSCSKDYKLVAKNTGLPVVRVKTPGGQAVVSKEDWIEGATMTIETADGEVDYDGSLSIRGRGNSTWNYPKKPYALKLDKKAKILGMPKHKRWILLANWKDRTLLRNDASFWVSRASGLPYTVRGYFVELEFNGNHVGNYYLCEQIKIDENRVDIIEMESQEKNPELISGGYLVELDTYYDAEKKFRSSWFNLPFQFKEPDETDLSSEAEAWFKDYIYELEKLFRDGIRVKNHEYEEFFDVDSSIEYMLVEELVMNHDFWNTWPSEGPHSCYMYKDRDGKLFTGPVWDFDYHTFVPDYTHMWFGAQKALYYKSLLKDEKYKARMLEIWNAKKEEFSRLPEYIDQMADHIRLSEEINQRIWPISNRENGDETMTFQQAVDRMKKAYEDKLAWMDQNLQNL